MRRPHEIVVVSTTRSPGWAGFGDAVIDQALIPTLPASTAVVVVALAVVVVARAVVVVGLAVVVEALAPTRSTDGHPALGAGMMSSSCSP